MKVRVKVFWHNDEVYVTMNKPAGTALYYEDSVFKQAETPEFETKDVIVATSNVDLHEHIAKVSMAAKEAVFQNNIKAAVVEVADDGTPITNTQGILPIHRLRDMWNKEELSKALLDAFYAGVNFEAGVEDAIAHEYVQEKLEELCLK